MNQAYLLVKSLQWLFNFLSALTIFYRLWSMVIVLCSSCTQFPFTQCPTIFPFYSWLVPILGPWPRWWFFGRCFSLTLLYVWFRIYLLSEASHSTLNPIFQVSIFWVHFIFVIVYSNMYFCLVQYLSQCLWPHRMMISRIFLSILSSAVPPAPRTHSRCSIVC